SQSIEKVQEALLAFLDREEQKVRQRLELPAEQPALVFESEDVFYYTAQQIAAQGGRWVVRVRAVNNTFAGEPLLAGFELIPEARVYRRGQVVARRTIDGSKPETVESELLQLLWDVNEQAIEDGMMTDEQGLVGQVDKADEFLEGSIAVKERGRPVAVGAWPGAGGHRPWTQRPAAWPCLGRVTRCGGARVRQRAQEVAGRRGRRASAPSRRGLGALAGRTRMPCRPCTAGCPGRWLPCS